MDAKEGVEHSHWLLERANITPNLIDMLNYKREVFRSKNQY